MKISAKCEQLKDMFPNYADNEHYIECKDTYYDLTMSCTTNEAMDQLVEFAKTAYDIFDVQALLAAYDIFIDLKKSLIDKYDF